MKIGYLRPIPSEFDVMKGSTNTLGTEIRMGITHDWLKLGHEVIVYTSTPKSFVQTKDIPKPKSRSLFDFGDEPTVKTSMWWDKLKLEPETLKIDADVLWIECGQFALYGADNDIRRMFEVLHNFKGTVIYHQHSNFSFPFSASFAKTTERQHSETNLTVYAHKYDIWTDKKWKVLSPTTNLKEFISLSKDRGNYQEYYDKKMVEFGFIPPAYSDIEPFFPIKQNPTYDSLFIGGINHGSGSHGGKQNSRYEIVKKYYGSGLYKTGVIGNWSEKIKSKDGTKSVKEIVIPNTQMLGVKGKHGDAYGFWNDSLTCINCSSEKNNTIGIVPSRFTMAIRGGSIMLTDKSFSGIEKYIERKFIVSNAEECKNIITEIKSMSIEEREKLRQEQLSKFPTWKSLNWNEIFK